MKKYYTSEDDELQVLWELLKYIEHRKYTNPIKIDYVTSVNSFLEDKGFITPLQLKFLGDIYCKNDVKEYIEKYVTYTYYNSD